MKSESNLFLGITNLHHAFYNTFFPISCSVDKLVVIRPTRWKRFPDVEATHLFPKKLKVLGKISLLFIAFNELIRSKKKFSGIIAFSPFPYGLMSLFLSKFFNIPFHVGIIGENPKDTGGLKVFLTRLIVDNAKTVSVSGSSVKNIYSKFTRNDKFTIIPHGISEKFRPLKKGKYFESVFLGDLLEVKNIDFIIKSWSLVVKQIPNARLQIVGSGPLDESLRDLVTSLHLVNNINFRGFTAHPELYLQNSKLVLFASKNEGLPFAMIEGMSCGCVPIVTDVGDISDVVVNDFNGKLLSSSCNIIDYSNSIVEVLLSPTLLQTLSKNSLVSSKKFRYENVIKSWDAIVKTFCE